MTQTYEQEKAERLAGQVVLPGTKHGQLTARSMGYSMSGSRAVWADCGCGREVAVRQERWGLDEDCGLQLDADGSRVHYWGHSAPFQSLVGVPVNDRPGRKAFRKPKKA